MNVKLRQPANQQFSIIPPTQARKIGRMTDGQSKANHASTIKAICRGRFEGAPCPPEERPTLAALIALARAGTASVAWPLAVSPQVVGHRSYSSGFYRLQLARRLLCCAMQLIDQFGRPDAAP